MIGDPSGRTDMRQMMTTETINHNVECFKKQMSRFIDFGEGKAMHGKQRRLADGLKLRGCAPRGWCCISQ